MEDRLHLVYTELAEGAVFTHWLVYNIPPSSAGLPEGLPPDASLPDAPGLPGGALQGLSDYPPPNNVGYGGPCPPLGETHFYFFTVYALDSMLNLPPTPDRDTLLGAMQGHILAQAELKTSYTGR